MTIQLNPQLKTEIKELLPVIIQYQQGIEKRFVDGRTLWTFLEVKSRFDDWFRNRIAEYGFEEKRDYWLVFNPKKIGAKNKQRGGHNQKDYLITLSMAKELAMVERNEQGKLAREYFIKCEEALLALAPERVQQLRQIWNVGREAVKSPFIKLCNAIERKKQLAEMLKLQENALNGIDT